MRGALWRWQIAGVADETHRVLYRAMRPPTFDALGGVELRWLLFAALAALDAVVGGVAAKSAGRRAGAASSAARVPVEMVMLPPPRQAFLVEVGGLPRAIPRLVSSQPVEAAGHRALALA